MITLDVFLTNVGAFLTEAIEWMGNVMNVVATNPPLMVMCLAIPVAGVAIGYLSRLIRL